MLKLNYKQLQKDFPLATKKVGIKSQSPRKLYNLFDNLGVRVFIDYGASGGFTPSVYRRRSNSEFKKIHPNKTSDLNWRMTRVGIINSYNSRIKAEKIGFEEGFKQLEILIKKENEKQN